MGQFGPAVSPAHDGITTGAVVVSTPGGTAQAWQVPDVATTFGVTNAADGSALPNLVIPAGNAALSWSLNLPGVDKIWLTQVNTDGSAIPGATPRRLFSVEAQEAGADAGADAAMALQRSSDANTTAQQALSTAQAGAGGITWDTLPGKPATFPATPQDVTVAQIRDAGTVGALSLKANDQQAARAAIGAGTGNGTSNLALGTTGTTAAAGNHGHTAASVAFTPAAGVTANNVQDAIAQAAAMGGSGGVSGSGSELKWIYRSGAYPALPATRPAGIDVVTAYGPVAPSTYPSWVGLGAGQAIGLYQKAGTA